MKYGILGDVHGNLEALECVLEQMENEGVKKYISVGDIVGYGANPTKCLAKIRALNAVIVAGNHDQAVCGILGIEFFNTYARESCQWTQRVMSNEDIVFLRNLKLTETVDTFSVAHSSFYFPENFEYIITSYDAHMSFDTQSTKIAFVGHSHIPVVFYKKKTVLYNQASEIRLDEAEKILVNVGSIGQPRDENPDSVYCVYDSDEGIVRLKRVKYDVEKAMKKIKDAGLPEILAERLKYGK